MLPCQRSIELTVEHWARATAEQGLFAQQLQAPFPTGALLLYTRGYSRKAWWSTSPSTRLKYQKQVPGGRRLQIGVSFGCFSLFPWGFPPLCGCRWEPEDGDTRGWVWVHLSTSLPSPRHPEYLPSTKEMRTAGHWSLLYPCPDRKWAQESRAETNLSKRGGKMAWWRIVLEKHTFLSSSRSLIQNRGPSARVGHFSKKSNRYLFQRPH